MFPIQGQSGSGLTQAQVDARINALRPAGFLTKAKRDGTHDETGNVQGFASLGYLAGDIELSEDQGVIHWQGTLITLGALGGGGETLACQLVCSGGAGVNLFSFNLNSSPSHQAQVYYDAVVVRLSSTLSYLTVRATMFDAASGTPVQDSAYTDPNFSLIFADDLTLRLDTSGFPLGSPGIRSQGILGQWAAVTYPLP